jgi:methylglyoxal synthase
MTQTNYKKMLMAPDMKIARVAHGNKKRGLVEWATSNRDLLGGAA